MFDYEKIWSGSWNDTTRYGPACRHRRRIVSKLVRSLPHSRVLDLGCGDGCLIAEMRGRFTAEFRGADISQQAIDIARKNVPGVLFEQLDVGLGIPHGPYDVVVMSEVLEHIEDDDAALRQVAAAARHIVISVPGGPPDKADTRYGHFRNYNEDLLKQKMKDAGFDVAYFRRWGVPFYELSQIIMNRCTEDAAAVAGGSYSPLKKLIARILYVLFFFNVLPFGSQVFAVGRSRTAFRSGAGDP